VGQALFDGIELAENGSRCRLHEMFVWNLGKVVWNVGWRDVEEPWLAGEPWRDGADAESNL
jgi:hypothetical protein